MTIRLQQVYPTYLSDAQMERSMLWKKDLEFKKGEKIHIIAPSGSGKTSLIHFLYGMRSDFKGSIRYDGQSLNEMDAESLATLRKKKLQHRLSGPAPLPRTYGHRKHSGEARAGTLSS